MRDIKTKEHERKPKTRNPTSKMPKELVRTAALEAKMKSNRAVDAAVSKESQASPTEYASEKLASAEEWTAGDAASFAVRKLVRKSCEKIKERKREAETAETAVTEAAGEIAEGTAGELKKLHQPAGTQGNVGVREGRGEALPRDRLTMQRRIKVKPESKELIRTAAGRKVKIAPRTVKTSLPPSEKIKAGQTVAQQKQALRTMRAARRAAAKTTESAGTARAAGKTAKTTVRGVKAAVQGAITSVKALGALLASAGGFLAAFIVIVGIIIGAMFSGSSQSAEPLSQEVLSYTPAIRKYASEYGIPEYVPILQAIMMQESGGRGTDPMQSSECPCNTRFPNSPNAITEPDYSIQAGVQYYASSVVEAGCQSPYDMDRLKLSLQGYNCVKRS